MFDSGLICMFENECGANEGGGVRVSDEFVLDDFKCFDMTRVGRDESCITVLEGASD